MHKPLRTSPVESDERKTIHYPAGSWPGWEGLGTPPPGTQMGAAFENPPKARLSFPTGFAFLRKQYKERWRTEM